MRASVASLITETVTYDEIKQPTTVETLTEVMVRVGGITRNEWTSAGQLGVQPELKLELPTMCYSGQKIVSFEGARYYVYRTYTYGDTMELYLEKRGGV